jgi:SPP1 gp7 family putative phage head morphogenesis protein
MNLAQFAKFDRHTKKWYGRPPSNVLASAIMANDKRAELIRQVNQAIDELATRADETVKTLSFSTDLPLLSMNQDVLETLPIGIRPTLDSRTAEKLRKDYTESQRLNVKNWTPEQVVRLREMVERYQTSESNESLTDMIMKEWGVTANKASFLARQETSLFFSKFSMNRASSAGVRRYRWATSHDVRVRESHRELQGTIHFVDDPPVVDLKTGRRAHPGEDFNCRCAAIWVLE